MAGAVVVKGMRDLSRAFALADKQAVKELRAAFREVAEPVRRDAEGLARSEIRRIGDKWPRMRIGVTRKVVYVAPKQRGVKTRGYDPRKRPNLADLLMNRAMEPALERNAPTLERAVEAALDRVCDAFND